MDAVDKYLNSEFLHRQENMHESSGGIVKLLWTGGFDSTFRLVELSKMEGVTVQPTYMYGDGRPSVSFEKKAKNEILNLLLNHSDTKAKILPLNEVDVKDIPANQVITDAYNRIVQSHKLGSQYEWIARYAAVNPGCELCVESPRTVGCSYMNDFIESSGSEVIPSDDIHRFKVHSTSDDAYMLLGTVFFPIINLSEEKMFELIKEWGYEDIIQHIWFCYTPIGGRPCGWCRPCSEKMESGMEFLLDVKARKRYMHNQKWGDNMVYAVYRHFYRKLYGDT